jgi:hypothetical protein
VPGEHGDVLAQSLLTSVALTVRRDGGIFYPIPGDNWNAFTYEAVLTVDPSLAQEFTTEITDRIREALGAVFSYHGRDDLQSLVIEQAAPQLPAISADWRDQAAQPSRQPPTSQARRERTDGAGDQAVASLVVAADVHQQSTACLGVECLGGRGAAWQRSPGMSEQSIDGLGGTGSGHIGPRSGDVVSVSLADRPCSGFARAGIADAGAVPAKYPDWLIEIISPTSLDPGGSLRAG